MGWAAGMERLEMLMPASAAAPAFTLAVVSVRRPPSSAALMVGRRGRARPWTMRKITRR